MPDKANPTPRKVYVVGLGQRRPPSTVSVAATCGDADGYHRAARLVRAAGRRLRRRCPEHQVAFGRTGNAGGEPRWYDVNGGASPSPRWRRTASLVWYEQKKDGRSKST